MTTRFRQTRTLEVAVSEAKGLSRAADFAVHVVVDGTLLARTPAQRGGPEANPVWSSVLEMEEVW